MPKKALASLNVVINAITSPLFRGLAIASKRLIAFGAKMKAVGRSISMSFTLPFVMIGAAGAKMAIDFERNMTKVNTLVGISKKEVNAFAKDVMKLSTETAQAPEELADGLFFLTSAGLRASNAMETLEAVAKGAAIGLGEQTDLAKVSAAAQNAYGEETITAAEALDVFGIAVQQGMFEASDLAAVLGTQLGLASSLGISFQETNAFIATYTKTTGDANAASTSFGGVMMALAKTTPKMGRALKKIGMTGDDVREMIGDKGLRGTLIHLKESFEAQNIPLTDFFSKSQALKGVLGVLGNQTETYGEVLDAMGGSAGFVEEGFDTLSKTAGFRLQKSFTNLKNAAMELGARLMPIFEKIIGVFTQLAKAFSDLDEGKKKLLLGAMALVAFSGPLMTLAGGLISILGMILSPIGLVVLAIGGLFYIITKNWAKSRKIFVDFINYWIDLYNESLLFRGMVESVRFVFTLLWIRAKFFFMKTLQSAKNFGSTFTELFGGIGEMLKGVFTGSWDSVKDGWKTFKKAWGSTFGGPEMEALAKEEAAAVESAVGTLVDNITSKDKVEFITEEQVQAGIDSLKTLLGDKFQQAKDYLSSLIGGGMLTMAEGGTPTEGPDDGKEEIKKFTGVIETKKSLLQQYFEWAKDGYEGMVEKVSETWGKISDVVGQGLDAISGMWKAQADMKMQLLENEKTAEEEKRLLDYENAKLKIENTIKDEEARDEALLTLKGNYDTAVETADDNFDTKKKALQKKAAERDKKLKIANAIMGTANAIVQALSAGPIAGPILATIVGAMGLAQISAIQSTPIPLAKGGLAFGPANAIVGDNPGAGHDPEVIAPLSKLQKMLSMDVDIAVTGVLRGQSIWLSNDKTTEKRIRYI